MKSKNQLRTLVKGASQGTVSDQNGAYSLTVACECTDISLFIYRIRLAGN